ncbi:MAG: hypothetical protein LBJ59_07375 [Zoogloeaceae bacterium]|nr:hypothetical protein [Zoogloeaceae bacterium]
MNGLLALSNISGNVLIAAGSGAIVIIYGILITSRWQKWCRDTELAALFIAAIIALGWVYLCVSA